MRFLNPLPSGKRKSFFSVKTDRQNIRPANLDYNPSVISASYFFQSLSSRISPKSPRFFRHNLSNKQFFISICNAKTPFPALMILHIDYCKVHLSDLKNCKFLSYPTETSAAKRISNPSLWSFHLFLHIASAALWLSVTSKYISNTMYFLSQYSRLPIFHHWDFGLGVNFLYSYLKWKKKIKKSTNLKTLYVFSKC